jgi:hypothetical protein
MKCEYNDGFEVDYSGSLRISKGNDINLTVKGGQINAKCRSDLDAAARHNSCSELRTAAQEVTDTIHEAWYKK